MVMILIDIPEDINKEVSMLKAKMGFDNKDEAIRYALSKFFKLKFDDAYNEETNGNEVKINK